MLGGFSLRRGSTDVTPAPGHPATLVKLLALTGTMTVDQVIDALWPDADTTTGRQRLRNLLNRIRAQSGDIVVRNGDALVLHPGVQSDVELFERQAAAALASVDVTRVGLARLAISAYAGDLLPGDAYADWAAAARERLRRRALSLLDIAATGALEAGELDEAVRLLDVAIGIEPFGEHRYVQAASMLINQGRRAAARDLVRRAVTSLDELGLLPGRDLELLAGDLLAA